MKNKFIKLLVISGFLGAFAAGCADDRAVNETADRSATSDARLLKLGRTAVLPGAELMKEAIGLLKREQAGEDVSAEAKSLMNRYLDSKEYVSSDARNHALTVLRVIDPSKYECDDSVDVLTPYIKSSTADWGIREVLGYMFFSDYLTYYTIFVKNADTKQSFGFDGEYTNVVEHTFRDLKKFFNIDTSDMQLVDYKGSAFADESGFARLFEEGYGLTAEEAAEEAAFLHQFFNTQKFDYMDHPLLSFNAFAIPETRITGTSLGTKNRIALGDGMLDAYKSVGLEDVAPKAILAHEFAHQIQFQKDYFLDVKDKADQPEATRYTELMADAYAAYFLTHKRGEALNRKRVEQFLQVFYTIGDCSFKSSGHHGTYNQRMAAAYFGFKTADQAQKQGHIMRIEDFYKAFNNAYQSILNAK